MKNKYIFSALIATLTLVSCSQDEALSENTGDVIKFATTTSASTRAAELFSNSNLMSSFNVWAYTSQGNTYMTGEQVNVSSTGTCTMDGDAHYWPSSSTLTFSATNKPEAATWQDGALSFVDYTVSNDVSEQEDLLYAVEADCSKPSDGTVNLNFRHALAQLVFNAKCTSTTTYVEISEIGVAHIADTGTLTLPEASTTVDGNVGTWSDQSGDKGCVVELGSAVALTSSSQALTTSSVSNYSSTMFVLPQSTEAWNTYNTNGSYFVIKCCIYNVTNGTFDASSDRALYGTQAEHKYILLPADFDWEAGKKYTYTILFGSGNAGIRPTGDGTSFDPDAPGDTTPTTSDSVLGTFITFDCTADDFAVTAETLENVTGATNHEYVRIDNSSIRWATCNLGAENSYEPGYYFEWAEVTIWDYHCAMTGIKITDFSGNYKYDAATAMWGTGWRTPTYEEMSKLQNVNINSNVLGSYTVDDVTYYTFPRMFQYTPWDNGKVTTSRTVGTIVLPAGGCIYPYSGGSYIDQDTAGYYWTSTPTESNNFQAYAFHIYREDSTNYIELATYYRGYGMNIRPVYDLNLATE